MTTKAQLAAAEIVSFADTNCMNEDDAEEIISRHFPGDGESEFKNFHRNICEASGYGHDEIDWNRDLASLTEHVRKLKAAIDKKAE